MMVFSYLTIHNIPMINFVMNCGSDFTQNSRQHLYSNNWFAIRPRELPAACIESQKNYIHLQVTFSIYFSSLIWQIT